jgi:hypothetical protein
MCPLLAQLEIGFFSSFFAAAVYSTILFTFSINPLFHVKILSIVSLEINIELNLNVPASFNPNCRKCKVPQASMTVISKIKSKVLQASMTVINKLDN